MPQFSSRGMSRSVKSTQRNPILLAFRVTGTGTAVIDEGTTDATLTDNGTGDYTLTFAQAFSRAPAVTATCVATAGDAFACIHTVSTTAVRIVTFDATDGTTAKDTVFHVLVYGYDSADVY